MPKTTTPRPLKVYGWIGFRSEAAEITRAATDGKNARSQTREILAARSAAEVRRIAGLSRTDWEHSGCETGNTAEIAAATERPGVVLWRPLDFSQREPLSAEWHAAEEREAGR